jgi:imidazolonepropionase
MPTADLFIRHARLLVTPVGPAPKRGAAQRDVRTITNAAIASRDGRIVFVGPDETCAREVTPASGARVIDASGHSVVPGFVDPHTHAVFAGDRR